MEKSIVHNTHIISDKIRRIREQNVLLDRDLAKFYGVETKYLKRQVRRNSERFPSDFMFELTKEELENWRRQYGTSNTSEKMGLRYRPMAFTEQGVAMLSSVINNPVAIQVNIEIMRVFTKMRKLLSDTSAIKDEIDKIKRRVAHQGKHIEHIFNYLDELLQQNENARARTKIGYKK